MTATAIKALARLPKLRSLTLRFQSGEVPSLKSLAAAPALESLTIEGPVNDTRLAEISSIAGLRQLSLEDVAAGRAAIANLAELRHLEEILLHGKSEDASALPALAALPYLTKLDVEYLEMLPKTAKAVKKACPRGSNASSPARPSDDQPSSYWAVPPGWIDSSDSLRPRRAAADIVHHCDMASQLPRPATSATKPISFQTGG